MCDQGVKQLRGERHVFVAEQGFVVSVAKVTTAERGRVSNNMMSSDDSDCGCEPNAGEPRRVSRRRITRRNLFGLGAVGAVASVFGIAASQAAFAADYPSWDDVLKAKNDEAAKAKEISRIEDLIAGLQQRVNETQAAARKAGEEFYVAQQDFFEQSQRADDLQNEADKQAAAATEAAQKAGQLAAQLYRNGGDNTSFELFFTGSAAGADDLLQKLGQMDKLLQHNQTVYDSAVAARNSAQSLSDQAVTARDERDRLQKVAEEKLKKAQDAADAAAAALADQEDRLVTLEEQLAALRDNTARTVADYEAGEKERKRREEEERRRREEEERNNSNNTGGGGGGGSSGGGGGGGGSSGGGGGGGGGGGQGPGNGWVRPHGGFQSSGYGPRVPDCDVWGCSSSFHYGVDLANGCWAPIYAAADGTVDAAFYNDGYGYYVRIQHGNGIATGYAHIVEGGFNVSYGQRVRAGQVIAYAGNTGGSFGCHLHFEVYQNGGAINPIAFMEARGVNMW